jgi:hypothetical protein
MQSRDPDIDIKKKLTQAVWNDDFEKAKNLLTSHSINANYCVTIKHGTTHDIKTKSHDRKKYPLVFLAKSSRIVRLLLQNGANPNRQGIEYCYSQGAGVTKKVNKSITDILISNLYDYQPHKVTKFNWPHIYIDTLNKIKTFLMFKPGIIHTKYINQILLFLLQPKIISEVKGAHENFYPLYLTILKLLIQHSANLRIVTDRDTLKYHPQIDGDVSPFRYAFKIG